MSGILEEVAVAVEIILLFCTRAKIDDISTAPLPSCQLWWAKSLEHSRVKVHKVLKFRFSIYGVLVMVFKYFDKNVKLAAKLRLRSEIMSLFESPTQFAVDGLLTLFAYLHPFKSYLYILFLVGIVHFENIWG